MTTQRLVVGVVGNDITNDSRVKKVAASASKAGYRSVVVCYSPTGVQEHSRMGDVEVIRVPVPFVIAGRHSRVPQVLRPVQAVELAQRHLGPRSRQLARRRRLESELLRSGIGVLRKRLLRVALEWTRASIWGRRQAFRLRRRAHITWDRVVRRWNLLRTRASARILRGFIDPTTRILDYELAFGPLLEELRPDLIHAHEHHMIGIAANAANRLKQSGSDCKVVYDAHEWVEGLSYTPAEISGWLREEGRFIREADAVLAVSPHQAKLLEAKYALQATPNVVMNTPLNERTPDVRHSLRDHTSHSGRILVYHGNLGRQRGVHTMVESLRHLPDDVHVAVLGPKESPHRAALTDLAERLSVEERFHLLDFVPPEELTSYLRSADLCVIPLLRTGNHDVSLPNKLFEALHAGLPVLTSDTQASAEFVLDTGCGLVFEQGNPLTLAARALEILEDRQRFSRNITEELLAACSWDAQADVLVGVYRDLLADTPGDSIHITAADVIEPAPESRWGDYRPTRLAIGPRNMAGQAFLLAEAVERELGVPAVSFSVEKPVFDFPIHRHVTPEAWRDPLWQTHQRRLLSSTFTHVLAESGTGMLGTLNGGFIDEQLPVLRADNLEVGILLHGSEVRDPRRHRHLPFSPYASDESLIRDLERATSRLRDHLDGIDVPLFVTTPDLLADVDATWVPVVIDVSIWDALAEPFQGDLPTVLHLPTNGLLKGSGYVDATLQRMEEAGLVRYVRSTERLDSGQVAELVAQADIVIDGIVLGAYGVMSCQAMAAGRIAIANIRDLGSLKPRCPIIDADPSTLETVLMQILSERERWKEIAEDGREFVATYHDGKYSAQQLKPFLGLDR